MSDGAITARFLILLSFSSVLNAGWVRLQAGELEVLASTPTVARKAVTRLRQVRGLFQSSLGGNPVAEVPLRIFIFASESEYSSFRHNELSAGFYRTSGERDYIALHAAPAEFERVLTHEYVHALMHRSGVQIPEWLNEGMAEFYSTVQVRGLEARLGEPVPGLLALMRGNPHADLRALVEEKQAQQGRFYAESWALVHMLHFSPSYQKDLPRFLEAVLFGAGALGAFETVYGRSVPEVERDIQSWVLRPQFPGLSIRLGETADSHPASAEAVDAIDMELLLCDLLAAMDRYAEADARLGRLSTRRPDDPRVLHAQGDAAVRVRDDATALRLYERAISLGNAGAQLRYDYALLLRKTGGPGQRVADQLRRALEVDPNHFGARYLLGHVLLEGERYEDAARQLQSAASLRPLDIRVFEELAMALHGAAKHDEAIAAATRARKLAVVSEDAARIEGMLKLVSERSSGEEPARTPTRPPERTRHSVEGVLVQVDCLDDRARLHIATGNSKTFLLAPDPAAVELRNSPSKSLELSCGPQPGKSMTVEYRPDPDPVLGTAGAVTAILFR